MKKTLSLILAILMIMATMPMALAADPIALTEANITTYPTASGEIYYGQKVSEGIVISGGEVQYNGTVVPGTFDFIDKELRPNAARNNMRASIKFTPDDTTTYAGFQISNCANVTYVVKLTTPAFADKENNPLVASEVELNATLSTSILSGGQCINPYNPDDTDFLDGTWSWSNSNTAITGSGLYEAQFIPGGRAGRSTNLLTEMVYVKVAGSIPDANIAEHPTIDELTYNPNITFADVNLNGGKAVIKGTDTEVSGTFTFVNPSWIPTPETTEIDVIFTPDNAEEALPYQFKIPVTVNKAPLAFLDENGNAVTEGFEFEVEPNEKINNIESKLYDYIQMPANSVYGIETDDTYAVNGKEYMVYVIHSDSNYVGSEIYFTVKFKETVVEPKIVGIGYNKYRMDCGSYSLPGTFAVAVMKDGALVDTIVTKSGAEFKFEPTASGKYTFNVTYVPTEGDYFVVDAFSKEYDVALNWAATIGDISTMHRCGDTVEAKVANTGVIGWKATDTNGNPVTLTLVSGTMESETFTFIMPDYNVIITPEFEAADDNNGGGILDGIGDIDGIDGILDFLKGIIEKIKSVFEKIIEFFQSIGDMS